VEVKPDIAGARKEHTTNHYSSKSRPRMRGSNLLAGNAALECAFERAPTTVGWTSYLEAHGGKPIGCWTRKGRSLKGERGGEVGGEKGSRGERGRGGSGGS